MNASLNRHAERDLAFHYAPRLAAPRLAALFALDDELGRILQTTREPMVGQMRLTWWHEALNRLDLGSPPAQPVLEALAQDVVPNGVTGERLALLVEGWEELLDPGPPDDDSLRRYAVRRGGGLFEMAGTLLGARRSDPLAAAGEGWALIDLARHLNDRATAERALALAADPMDRAMRAVWSRPARSLGAIAHLARMDATVPLGQQINVGSPRRVMRLLWHRLTGR